MKCDESLVIQALRRPEMVRNLDFAGWNVLLRQARQSKTLPRMASLIGGHGWTSELPAKVLDHLAAARVEADKHQRMICWEVRNISRTLAPLDTRVILLKGAAYVKAELPPARGRKVNDVDILVPKSRIGDVESALLAQGWVQMKLDAYDQRYYRKWMHELPPLKHTTRKTVTDVHHTILPESGRLKPDPAKLFAAARPLGGGGFFMLAPEDMVLHSAAHLFQDGDLAGGLRDLKDIDDLLRHFGRTEKGFWRRIVPRARELDLDRPLYYALHFTQIFFRTPIPSEVQNESLRDRPSKPVSILMNYLVIQTLTPRAESGSRLTSRAASLLLYIRSHWLRMPPHLLAKHLGHKMFLHILPKKEEDSSG